MNASRRKSAFCQTPNKGIALLRVLILVTAIWAVGPFWALEPLETPHHTAPNVSLFYRHRSGDTQPSNHTDVPRLALSSNVATLNWHTGPHLSAEMFGVVARLAEAEKRRLGTWQILSGRTAGTGVDRDAMLVTLTATVTSLVLYCLARRRKSPRKCLERLCFQQAAEGLMLCRVTESGHFIYEDVNTAWLRICGLPSSPMFGEQPQHVWPANLVETASDHFQHCLASGQPLQIDGETPCGHRHFRIVITPVRDAAPGRRVASGRIVMLICQAHDTTEDFYLSETLCRDRQLENFRRFSAGVAHDFNNILQAICSGLELILDETAPHDPSRDLAMIALSAAQRGGRMTQNLLGYASRLVLSPQPIDLRKWLPSLRSDLEQAIGPTNHLELFFAGGTNKVFADETGLRTALVNIALNAGRAMRDGGCLRIVAEPTFSHDGAMQYIAIRATDTGSGMDEATLAICREPFFTTKGPNAIGLGLSMVLGFAAQSGGSLWLSSHPGQGTTVVLSMPAYAAERMALTDTSAPAFIEDTQQHEPIREAERMRA